MDQMKKRCPKCKAWCTGWYSKGDQGATIKIKCRECKHEFYTTTPEQDTFEAKAQACREKFYDTIMDMDDQELSYVAGATLMRLCEKGYCQVHHVTDLEKIIGDEFEKRIKDSNE